MTTLAPAEKTLYQRAEEIARGKAVMAGEVALSPEKLLHELRVSLVELELQNEELRRTRGELEDARRRQAEASEHELKKNRVLLAETEKIGMVGGWEFDIGTGKQTWTDQIYEILEVDRSFAPTVENGINFYTPASRPIIERALHRNRANGEPFDEELELTTAKGKLKSVHVIGKADPENNRIYGFFQDITGRKRSESYREMAREALQILNQPGTLESLLPEVIAALKARTGFDAVGIRLQAGDDYPYFFQQGFPQDFLLAENTLVDRLEEGGLCRNKDGSVCLECTCGLVICGKGDLAQPFFTAGGSFWTNDSFPMLDIPAEEDPRLHPHNECIHQGYASVALVPIRDSGKIVGLIQFNDLRKDCFTSDTVERLEEIAAYIGALLMRKRLEDEKLALQQQCQDAQKLESLGVLAGGVAHDFNNLLMIIIGHCSLAKLDPGLVESGLGEIEKAAESAAGLCRKMLAYAGKSRFAAEEVDLRELLDEMVSMLKSGIPHNAAIRLEVAPDDAIIKGDASQLRQVIMNLMLNASEAIGDDPGEIGISLVRTRIEEGRARDHLGRAIPSGRYACLEVSDTGCGMGAETMRRIFEPFYSTKFTGRGLGLSATLGIINSHGGALQFFSQQRQGTTFKIYLPVAPGELAAKEPPQVAAAAWRGSGTVLLVEDEDQVRTIGRSMLQTLGFDVIEASNGSEALQVYRRAPESIDLVLTDMGMPVMDGYQLYRELKRLDHELPVIISSGFGDDSIAGRMAGEPVAGLLGKPYSFDRMREVLKSVTAPAT